VNNQGIIVVHEVNYLGITLENTGGWNKQNVRLRAKGGHALVVIDKCLAKY
jgi:hypothetical protein